MHSELRAIRFGESEIKQALTIVDELALSLDRIGALSDSPESAKDALWEYMSTLQAGQRVMHLRGILSDAVARELGEDAYLGEREAVLAWPRIGPPEGTEQENPWWSGADRLVGDAVGRFGWPVTVDTDIPQDVLAQLRTVPTHFHGVYSVLDGPCRVTSQGGPLQQGLIAFAKSNGRICVDTPTGSVVKTSQYIVDLTTPVNSSLIAFERCVHACAMRYPFYSEDSSYAVRDAVCDEVHHDLLEIDSVIDEYPASAFWHDVTARLLNGELATERMRRDYHVKAGRSRFPGKR